jgi:predicted SprT family Zn-dependent metalloprotease
VIPAQEWREKWTPKTLYRFWNSRYFANRLPDIPVWFSAKHHKASASRNKMGGAWFDSETKRPIKITLNPKYRTASRIWMQTLLHEMVHVQQWRIQTNQAHGNKFNKRMKQLAAKGAFRALW